MSFAIFIYIEYSNNLDTIKSNEKIQISLAKTSLVRDFEHVLPDMSVITHEQHLQQMLINNTPATRRIVTSEFVTFLIQKRLYDQISMLDIHGKELIRVNYSEGNAYIVTEQALEDVSSSLYFKNGINLGRSELHISPVDLKAANGHIVKPVKPVIRFTMPLYDQNDINRGLIILSYLAEPMLRHFDEMLSATSGHVALLNDQAHWMRSHKKEREWAYLLGNQQKFSDDHPAVWSYMNQHNSGQILNEDGLFTFATIYPISLIGGYSKDEVDNTHIGHHHLDHNTYKWKIISDVPLNVIDKIIYDYVSGIIGWTWLMIAIIGYFLSRILSRNFLERKHLAQQNSLHAKIFEASTDGIIITDASNKIIAINNAYTQITGYSADEVLGKDPGFTSAEKQDPAFYKKMWADISKHGQWSGELYNKHKDGNIFAEALRISSITNTDNRISNYIAIISDITTHKNHERRLNKLAHNDAITGLYNRHAFEETLKNEINYASEQETKLALLFIDLDKFKPINDTYGHHAGDKVLHTVASRLLKTVRDTDTVSRVGGDEFTIILTNIKNNETAPGIREKLIAAIEIPIAYKDQQLCVSASIGIASFPEDGLDSHTLISKADKAMYKEKSLK